MIIDEKQAIRKLKRKLFRSYYKCPFCNRELLVNEDIGYVKSKLSEVFFHNTCYRNYIKGE